MSTCVHPASSVSPMDVMVGMVETTSGTTIDLNGLTFDPTGSTDILWDTAKTVGVYCQDCDTFIPLTDKFEVWGETYRRDAEPLQASGPSVVLGAGEGRVMVVIAAFDSLVLQLRNLDEEAQDLGEVISAKVLVMEDLADEMEADNG